MYLMCFEILFPKLYSENIFSKILFQKFYFENLILFYKVCKTCNRRHFYYLLWRLKYHFKNFVGGGGGRNRGLQEKS